MLLLFAKFSYEAALTIPSGACTDTGGSCSEENPTEIYTNLYYNFLSGSSSFWIKIGDNTSKSYPWILVSNLRVLENKAARLPCATEDSSKDPTALTSLCFDFSLPPNKYFILKPEMGKNLYLGSSIDNIRYGCNFNLIQIPFSNLAKTDCFYTFLSNYVEDHFVITKKTGEGDITFDLIKDKTVCFVNTHYGDGFSWSVDLNFTSATKSTGEKWASFSLCKDLSCIDNEEWSGINNSLNNDRNNVYYFKLKGYTIQDLDIFDLKFSYSGSDFTQTGNLHQVIGYSEYKDECSTNDCSLISQGIKHERPSGYPPFPDGPYIPPTPSSFIPTKQNEQTPKRESNHGAPQPEDPEKGSNLPAIIGGAAGGVIVIIIIIVVVIIVVRKKGKKEIEANTPDVFNPSNENNKNDQNTNLLPNDDAHDDKPDDQEIPNNDMIDQDIQNEQVAPDDNIEDDYMDNIMEDVHQMHPYANETDGLLIDESEVPDIKDIIF